MLKSIFTLIITSLFCLTSTYCTVFEVGVGKEYTLPSQLMSKVSDNDTILIDSGLYSGDVGYWKNNNLLLRGVGGYAHLEANGKAAGGKAIWVIQGNNTTMENIEFSGASVPDRNGACIRQEGIDLTIRHCSFHDNENGILAGDNPSSTILIEFSEFARNGYGDGYSHNIYINHIKKFTLQFCYSHHAKVGHCVKTRAYESEILYNRIMDEETGSASMLIDIPNGGVAFIVGNELMKGEKAQNPRLIEFGAEGLSNPQNELYVVNNTLVTKYENSNFIFIQPGIIDAHAYNNLMVGSGIPLSGFLPDTAANVQYINPTSAGLSDPSNYDYHLLASSPAIDNGAVSNDSNIYGFQPLFEYKHPTDSVSRKKFNRIDIGAYEYYPATRIKEKIEIPESVNIFPNPTNGLLHISFNYDVNIKNITLINNLGNEVLKMDTNQFNNNVLLITLNLNNENVSTGLYLCRIQFAYYSICKPIVVIK
jgi:hypothetical protein